MYYNLLLFQIEVIVFFISLGYGIYYIGEKLIGYLSPVIQTIKLKKIKNEIKPQEITKPKKITSSSDSIQPQNTQQKLTKEELHTIAELLKKTQINVSKGEYDIARNLIIEGLTIDKFNIDLNLELAGIYILEQDFYKAEYIYKDLLLVHSESFTILKSLAYVLSMQEKYDLALEIYKRAYDLKKDDFEVINMIGYLHFYKENYIEAISFFKLYLKENSRSIEHHIYLGESYKFLGKILDALNTYKKILEFDPYNKEIQKYIDEIEGEEESS